MRPRLARARWIWAALSLPFALGTCTEGGTGLAHRAALSVTTTMPSSSELASFNLVIDNVRLIVVRPPSDTLFNQVFAFPPGQTTLPLQADVNLESDQEDLEVTIQLLSGTQVLFSGKQTVTVGTSPSPPQVNIPVSYSGPGQNVATIRVDPPDSVLSFGAGLTLRATAYDGQGSVVPSVYIGWSTSDALLAPIDATGHLVAPPQRTTVTVTAAVPNGVTGSTSLTFMPVATAINIVSGCGQSGLPGAQLSLPVIVKIIASDNLGVKGVTVQFGTPPGGLVAPAQVVTDANGLAQTLVTLGSTPGSASFSISAGGLSTVTCNQTVLGATTLAFTTQPSTTAVGSPIAPPVVVTARDGLGNLDPAFTGSVTIAIGNNPGGAILSGTLTVAAIAGVATFDDLSLNVAGSGYTLFASAAGLTSTTSSAFAVSGGAATQLVCTSQPASITAGTPLTPVVVTAKDGQGNTATGFTGNVTLAFGTHPVGTTLGGTTTVAAAAGVATFSNLANPTVAGGYSLVASSPGLQSVVCASFTIDPGPPSQLAFKVQPSTVSVGAVISPIVQVAIEDAFGNTVTSAIDNVTLAIGTNPGSALLGGTLTRAAASGVALFTNLTLSQPGVGYTLIASSGTLIPATSAAFDVTSGAVTHLAVVVTPPTVTAGVPAAITVTAQDASNNTVTGYRGTVHFTSADLQAVLPADYTFTAGDNGVHAFPAGVTLKTAGSQSVAATDVSIGSITGAQSVSVTPASALALFFTVQPSGTSISAAITPPVQVTARDAFGNTATGFVGSVLVLIGNNPGSASLAGTLSHNAIAGVATFAGLSLDRAGVGYTLTATATGLTGATSSTFNISALSSGVAWNNPLGGNWNVAANWLPTRVPAKGDTVFITLPGAYTVTLDVNDTVAFLTLGGVGASPMLVASSRTFGIDSGAVIAANATLSLAGTTINGGSTFTNTGTILITPGGTTLNGALTVTSGGTLRLNGNNGFADLTVPTMLSNAGTIELMGTSWAGRLTVTTGALVNGPGAMLQSSASAGNSFTGTLNNQGTVQIDGPLTLNGASADHLNSGAITLGGGNLTLSQSGTTPSFTTTGSIVVGAGRTLQVNGGTFNYANAVPGGLAGLGTVSLSGATLALTPDFTHDTLALTLSNAAVNGPGTLRVAGPTVLTISQTTINAPFDNLGTVQAAPGVNQLTGAVVNESGGTLRLNGNNGFADMTVAAGFTNAGTIELTGTSWAGRLTIASGTLVNDVGGTLHSMVSAGNALTGVLDNRGAVLVDGPLTISGASAHHLNSGTITLGSANLTVTQSGTAPSFATSGDVVVGSGRTWTVTNGALDYTAGKIEGNGTLALTGVTLGLGQSLTHDTLQVSLSNTTVNGPGTLTVASGATMTVTQTTFNAAFVNQGTVQAVPGTDVFNGPLTNAVGALLRLNGNNGFADVTVATGLANQGTIQLAGTSWAGRLTVSGGNLINSPSGAIQSQASAGNVLTATLDNQGAVQIDGPLTLNAASADHVNSGTITLGLGNLTLSQSGTTPSFTTTGSVLVGSGRTLQVNGGAFNYANAVPGGLAGLGTVSLSGATFALTPAFTVDTLALTVTNSTVNGPGTLTVAAGRTLTLTSSTVNASFDNFGTVQATPGTNVLGGLFTNQVGALLRLNGNNGFADVSVASGFTNAGTIQLTGTSWSGRLTVSSGTLINGTTGSLQSLTSAGNVLTAVLDNRGAVQVDGLLTLNAPSADHLNSGTITLGTGNLTVSQSGTTPSFATTGDVVIGAGRTWTVSSGALSYSGGKIEGNGLLALSGVTLGLGQSLVHDTLQVSLTNATVNGPGSLTVAVGATMTVTSSTINAAFINQGTVLSVPGVNTFNGALTNANGALLRLNGNNGFADVTVAGGFTNSGTIELAGTSWAGRLTVGTPTAATLTNASGATLHSMASAGNVLTAVLSNLGAVLVDGPLTLNGASADHQNSGSITLGAGNLTLSQTGTTPSFTTTGNVVVGTGRVLQVNGGAFTYANATPGGLAGLGTVNFSNATLGLNPDFTQDTLTLGLTGTIVNGPGTLTVAVGRTLTLTGSTLNTTLANLGTVQATPGTNLLNGPFSNQAGAMLRLNGNNGFADVTVASGFTNDGTIELTGTSWAGRLTVGSPTPATLVNGPTGTLQTVAGAGNVLTAVLDNRGTVQVGGLLTLNAAAAGHSNTGLIKLAGGDLNVVESGFRPGIGNFGTIDVGANKMVVSGTGSFINQSGGILRGSGGTFDVATPSISFITNGRAIVDGSPGGRLNWVGTFTQGPSLSTLELNVAGLGANPGTDYDQLNVSDNVTIQGGALQVTGVPVSGETYIIIQVPAGKTITGDFQTKTGLGQCTSGVSGTAYVIAC